jgi:hypothetical protein
MPITHLIVEHGGRYIFGPDNDRSRNNRKGIPPGVNAVFVKQSCIYFNTVLFKGICALAVRAPNNNTKIKDRQPVLNIAQIKEK